MISCSLPSPHRGFTLIEMAVVLAIILILMGGLIAGITTQMDARNQAQTDQTLADIREALLGFAASQGRLPCPAPAPAAGGSESPVGGACNNALNGYVPGTTLGITPTDQNGYVRDGWNQPIRYAVTTANGSAFTTTPGVAGTNIGIRGRGIANLTPDLHVCSTATGATAAACQNATVTLAADAVAVIYSIGKNGAGAGADESANRDGNAVFVSHDPVASGGGNDFDDQVIWLSKYILYGRMIAAGQLP